jgi:hypothetical protein
VEISHNLKAGALVAAACVAAGGGAAYVVTKLHSGSASAAPPTSKLQSGVIGRPDGSGFFRFDRKGPGPGFGRIGSLSTAADYLGLPTSELLTKLQSGQTLAQIADATSGKSAQGLIEALTKAEQSRLDAAVKSGRITQEQANALGSNLNARVTAMVNGRFGFRFGFRDRGERPSPSAPTL